MMVILRVKVVELVQGDLGSDVHLSTGQQFGERQKTLNGPIEYVYVDENDIVIYMSCDDLIKCNWCHK